MFKKPFKVKSNIQLKVTDRKKLHIEIIQQFPQLTEEKLNFILPCKKGVFQLNVLCHEGQAVTIYCLLKEPIFFRIKRALYPTVCLLWKIPDLLYTFTTYPEVLQFLTKGADLMLPGVVWPEYKEEETFVGFNKGDQVAVNLTTNKAAVVVGKAAISSYEMCAKKGKCVETLHFYGDNLSTFSTILNIPELGPATDNKGKTKVDFTSTDKIKDPGFLYLAKITGKEGSSQMTENSPSYNNEKKNTESNFNDGPKHNEIKCLPELNEKENVETDKIRLSKESDESNLSMDDLLRYCFFKSLKVTIKKEDLPILTSNFCKLHLIPMCPKGKNLEIKSTSYKKLSNFLNEMDRLGVVKIETPQKGVQMITKIDFTNNLLRGFVCSNEGANSINNTNSVSPAPRITEKYIVTAEVLPLFQKFNYKKRESLTADEVVKVIKDHVNVKNLISSFNKSEVILDWVLRRATNLTHSDIKVLSLNEVMSRVFAQMENAFKVEVGCNTNLKVTEVKGNLQPIDIKVQTRPKDKKVTIVSNLELFGINLVEFSKQCQHGAAASTTINTLSYSKKLQLQIQGNQVAFLGKILMEKYKIPIQYLRVLENASKETK